MSSVIANFVDGRCKSDNKTKRKIGDDRNEFFSGVAGQNFSQKENVN